jgi:hypothetical protein
MTTYPHPIIAPSGEWTLGVKLGLPVAAMLAVACLAALVFGLVVVRHEHRKNYGDTAPGWIVSGIATVGLLVTVVITLFCTWPLDAAYHQYRDVTGTVQQVSSRLLSAGDKGGTNQKFVVVLRGDPGRPFGIDDTRAALLRRGDTVHLRCIRVYEYGSTNAGYDCKWGG